MPVAAQSQRVQIDAAVEQRIAVELVPSELPDLEQRLACAHHDCGLDPSGRAVALEDELPDTGAERTSHEATSQVVDVHAIELVRAAFGPFASVGIVSPKVEVLWWRGCPSTPEAIEELRAIMRELGLDPEAVEVREVHTDERAAQEGFVGSPTIRVDGRDVQPPGPDEPVGLNCRVYRLRDGRVSPTPDPQDVREALLAATDSVRR
jgi:hypothetical protein